MPEEYKCQMCGGTFPSQEALQQHNREQHPQAQQQAQQQQSQQGQQGQQPPRQP